MEEMRRLPHTAPNDDSVALVLEACVKTERGRHYARDLLQRLSDDGDLTKAALDRWLELKVLVREPYTDVLAIMSRSETAQPTAETVLIVLAAFRKAKDWEGALQFYHLQQLADKQRRLFCAQAAAESVRGCEEAGGAAVARATMPAPLRSSVLSLPPTTTPTLHALLELLRDHGRFREAAKVLLGQAQALDTTAFAIALEACSAGGEEQVARAEMALALFAELERRQLAPDRRVFAALIRAFSLRGDVPSALGVFEEMLASFPPDTRAVQNIIDACMRDAQFLRTLVFTLERLAEQDGVDLAVFSGDCLLQGFSDSRSLGRALVDMESCSEVARTRGGMETVLCSLDVLSVLVRGCVAGGGGGGGAVGVVGVADMVGAMRRLGALGISPNADTMDYFRIEPEPERGAPGSSHYHQKLRPHGLKQHSLLDMDLPEGLTTAAAPTGKGQEPYFKAGGGKRFDSHVDLLRSHGRDEDGGDEDGEDDDDAVAHLSEDARLTLAEAAQGWAAIDHDEQPIELAEQFLMQRGPKQRRR